MARMTQWLGHLPRRVLWGAGAAGLVVVLLAVMLGLRLTVFAQPAAAVPALYYALDDRVRAVRASDGTPLWQTTVRATSVAASRGAVIAEGETQIALLDEATGQVRWHYTWSFTEHASLQTVIVGEDAVYLAFDLGHIQFMPVVQTAHALVVSLNRSDGHVRWQYPIAHVITLSPMLTSDALIVGTNSYVGIVHDIPLVVLNVKDGAVRWQQSIHEEHLNPVGISGDVLITRGGAVRAFSLTTGKLLWQMPTQFPFGTLACVAGGTVFASIYSPPLPNGSTPQRGSVVAARASDGSTLWQRALTTTAVLAPMNCTGGTLIVGEFVPETPQYGYMGLDALTGATRWQVPATANLFVAAVLDAPTRAVFATAPITVATTPAPITLTLRDVVTDTPLWTRQVGAGTSSGENIFLANQSIVVALTRDNRSTTVYSLDAATGALRWTHDVPLTSPFALATDNG